jgi:hypothetical protein
MNPIIKTASLCLLCFALYIVKAIQISNGERETSSMLCCIAFLILFAIYGLRLVTLIEDKKENAHRSANQQAQK